jgi:hypothetical protein
MGLSVFAHFQPIGFQCFGFISKLCWMVLLCSEGQGVGFNPFINALVSMLLLYSNAGVYGPASFQSFVG